MSKKWMMLVRKSIDYVERYADKSLPAPLLLETERVSFYLFFALGEKIIKYLYFENKLISLQNFAHTTYNVWYCHKLAHHYPIWDTVCWNRTCIVYMIQWSTLSHIDWKQQISQRWWFLILGYSLCLQYIIFKNFNTW